MNQHLYTERQLAKGFAHFVYRNTVIEDLHAADAILDEAAYKKIYQTVYAKVKQIEENREYLYLFDCGENIAQELDKITRDRVLSVIHFLRNVAFNCFMGSDWDEAELMQELPKRGVVSYILGGHFKECCDKHAKLTDETMCYINKDIYNRIYTLVVNNLL